MLFVTVLIFASLLSIPCGSKAPFTVTIAQGPMRTLYAAPSLILLIIDLCIHPELCLCNDAAAA